MEPMTDIQFTEALRLGRQARRIVEAIWRDLMGRSGFGSALDDEDPAMEIKIQNDLITLILPILMDSTR